MLALLCGIGLLRAQDPEPSAPRLGALAETAEDLTDAGFVVVGSDAPETCYLQEPIELSVRVAIDEDFLASQMVQLFGRSLDVPVEVEAPWLESLPEVVLRDPPIDDGPSIAFAGRVVRAAWGDPIENEGRRYRVLELRRTCLPTEVGDLVLPAPTVKLARATEHRDDPLRGRIVAARSLALVRGRAAVVQVEPLPEEGRPPAFGGAVGEFSVRATAETMASAAGWYVDVELRITGEGNFELFEPPDLRELAGLHIRARQTQRREDGCVIRYELSPVPGERIRVEPVAFPFFDPRAGRYRSVRVPIPIEGLPHTPAPQRGVSPPLTETAAPEAGGGLVRWLVAAAALLAAAAGWWVLRSRSG